MVANAKVLTCRRDHAPAIDRETDPAALQPPFGKAGVVDDAAAQSRRPSPASLLIAAFNRR
jgi:hypothetical protein